MNSESGRELSEADELTEAASDYSKERETTPPASNADSDTLAPSLAKGQVCSNCGTSKTPLWRRSPTGAVICNACGLYLKARNTSRPVKLKRSSADENIHYERSMHGPKDAKKPPPTQASDRVEVQQSMKTSLQEGSCPGGGQCNGTGGAAGCNGCPAFNNRLSKKALEVQTKSAPTTWKAVLNGLRNDSENFMRGESDSPVESPAEPHPKTASSSTPELSCRNCATTVTPLWRRDEQGYTICNACGLYHKLHGVIRPVALKKSTIKRRKRIVPVGENLGDQSEAVDSSLSAEHASSTPHKQVTSTSGTGTERSEETGEYITGAHRKFHPPPVDFTDYHASETRMSPTQSSSPQGYSSHHLSRTLPDPFTTLQDHSRKRSLSQSEQNEHKQGSPAIVQLSNNRDPSSPNRLSSISALLNPSALSRTHESSGSMQLPPLNQNSPFNLMNSQIPLRHSDGNSLSSSQSRSQLDQESPVQFPPLSGAHLRSAAEGNASPTSFAMSNTSTNVKPSRTGPIKDKSRHVQLRREAEDLREALRRKEREIEELE